MPTIVINGGPNVAPVYITKTGEIPSWSGKTPEAMTEPDYVKIVNFILDDACDLGMEDFIEDRSMMNNPFHPQYLFGIPHATFNSSYQRGQYLAAGSWSAPQDNFVTHQENSHDRRTEAISV